MKKYFFIATILIFYNTYGQRIELNEHNYSLKDFGAITYQDVNLSQYKSPNMRKGQDSDKLVILCSSGGGARAAAYTIGVLLELERINVISKENENSNAANEIDYFSTVSGGGWGAATYIAFLYQREKYKDYGFGIEKYNTYNSFENYLANWSDRKYARFQIDYALKGIFTTSASIESSNTFMNRLNAGYVGWSERKNIEKIVWNNRGKGEIPDDSVDNITLGDVFKLNNTEDIPQYPMLIANATNIDNFMLVPFTPDRLHFWGLSQYVETNSAQYPRNDTGALCLSELLKMPLAAGIKASSSVPIAIGPSEFPCDGKIDYLHLEDGGIVDNQGLHTVKNILKQNDKIIDRRKRIVIVIDAAKSGIEPTRSASKKKNRRISSLISVATNATPDAQYCLMREDVQALEQEYNCTVIYLSTESLLDPGIGKPFDKPVDSIQHKRQKKLENEFYRIYAKVKNDTTYYRDSVSMESRHLLYGFIRSQIKTWFSAKKTDNSGRYLNNKKAKGYSQIMFLAGRATVQLNREKIIDAFDQK